MKRPLFETPSPIDLIGLPTGKYWTHKFPEDIAAAEVIQITLGNVEKRFINFSDKNLQPDRHQKQPQKQERHTEITLQFSQKIKAIELFLNLNSKIVFLFGRRETSIILRPEILKPIESQIITYYKRINKRKILNACFLGPGHPVASIDLAMSSCDVIMAIDTNSHDVPGIGRVSATTAIEAYIKEVTKDACFLQSGPMRQQININSPGNPEIFGIGKMMFHFFETNPIFNNKKVGIITDTEFSLLKEINLRKIPFFEAMMLPENITLFYATSDSGSAEFMPNRLIRECENASSGHLKNFLRDHSHSNNE